MPTNNVLFFLLLPPNTNLAFISEARLAVDEKKEDHQNDYPLRILAANVEIFRALDR